MNNLKLLYCGRINFWTANTSQPKRENRPTVLKSSPVGFSNGERSLGEVEETGPLFLGSSHAVISDIPKTPCYKTRRGQLGITSHGRAQVRGGCRYLEETYGVKNLTFLTATLPNSAIYICEPKTWAIVVNRFCKKIRWHLGRAGLCKEIIAAVEVQEKRLTNTNGVPPLHLHLVFQGRKPYGHWQYNSQFFQNLWVETYRTVWQQSEPSESSCRTESIRSSAVSYMGKYLSKGGKTLTNCLPQLLPSSWYSISSSLKAFLKNATVTADHHLAQRIFEFLQSSELLKWARDIWSCEHGNGSSYLVGWVGEFRDRADYRNLSDFIKSESADNTEIQKYRKFMA